MVFIKNAYMPIMDIPLKTLMFLILSGLSTGTSWLFYFKALQIGDVNKVVPIDKSSTALTIVFAFIFLNEKVTIYKTIGTIMIAIGTYLMIEKKKSSNNTTSNKYLIYAFLSAVFASLTSILGKIGIENIDSALGTAIRTIVVLVMARIVVFVSKENKQIKYIPNKELFFIASGGVSTGASRLFYYKALQIG